MVVLALFVEDGSGVFVGDLCRFLVDVALDIISLFLFFFVGESSSSFPSELSSLSS
jgi:hypothetical protein